MQINPFYLGWLSASLSAIKEYETVVGSKGFLPFCILKTALF
jgi:hypothetical protein